MFNETDYALLDLFSKYYRFMHGYASLLVCLVGIALNFFNIIVLTRKHMLSSTNAILTALAISDFITMLVYIPTAVKFYCILGTNLNQSPNCSPAGYDYFWTVYALFFVNFTVTMHSISIWLTVLLAFFRYIYICHNKTGKKLCTKRNTIIAIAITYAFSIFLCMPSYFVSKIIEINNSNQSNSSKRKIYNISKSDIDRQTNGLIFRITFFIQAFCVKLIPCILIIVLSSLLLRAIRIANKNHKLLINNERKIHENDRSREHYRTNIMLVLVCFFFFVTEFPQGVLALLSIIFESANFHSNVYMRLGDVMDILALINNAVNFILYCRMSYIFRQTFKNVFCLLKANFDLNDLSKIYKFNRENGEKSLLKPQHPLDRIQSCPVLNECVISLNENRIAWKTNSCDNSLQLAACKKKIHSSLINLY